MARPRIILAAIVPVGSAITITQPGTNTPPITVTVHGYDAAGMPDQTADGETLTLPMNEPRHSGDADFAAN